MIEKKFSFLRILVVSTLLFGAPCLQKNANALIKAGVGFGTTGIYFKAGYYLFNTVGILAEYSNDFGIWNKIIDKTDLSDSMIEGGTGKIDVNTKAYGLISSAKPFAAWLPVPFLSANNTWAQDSSRSLLVLVIVNVPSLLVVSFFFQILSTTEL